MTQTSKPVTPKTLIMMSTGLTAGNSPLQFRTNFVSQTRRKTQSISLPKPDSPLPGFMKEYLINCDLRASRRIGKAQKDQQDRKAQRVRTTQPQVRRKERMWKDEGLRKEDCVQESKVFRIYRPQVIEISPRSKFTIYSTVNLTNTSPLKRIQRCNFDMGQTAKVTTAGTRGEEVEVEVGESKDYLKPALTFGEKLWRLNEVSIFSMVNK